jgi:hypothetical protein
MQFVWCHAYIMGLNCWLLKSIMEKRSFCLLGQLVRYVFTFHYYTTHFVHLANLFGTCFGHYSSFSLGSNMDSWCLWAFRSIFGNILVGIRFIECGSLLWPWWTVHRLHCGWLLFCTKITIVSYLYDN